MESFFKEEVRENVQDMYEYISEAFADMIDDLDWMDDDTKDAALDKLEDVDVNVGYMDEIFDDQVLDEKYGDYLLMPDMSYVEMVLRMEAVNYQV